MFDIGITRILRLSVLVLICSFICGSNALAAEQITLKLAHTSAPKTIIFETYEMFKKELEAKTNGRVKVQIYPLSQLGGDVASTESVIKGALDISSCGTNNLPPFTELFFWADLPFIFKNIEGVHAVYGGAIGKEFKEKLEEQTPLKCLFFADTGGFRNLMNSKHPIHSPADMQGLKFRSAPSPVEMDTIRAFGANPTPVNWPETYMALEQRVVDGEMQQYHWAVTARHQEVVKYVSELPGQHALHLAVINKDKFKSFPEDIQKAILEAAEAAQAFNFANAEERNGRLRQIVLDAGVTIETFTPEQVAVWRKLGETVWVKYADKVPQSLIDRVLAAQK